MATLKVKKLQEDALIPEVPKQGNIGVDLIANEIVTIPAFNHINSYGEPKTLLELKKLAKDGIKVAPNRKVVKTNVAMEFVVPEDGYKYYFRIAPRSGNSTLGIDIGAGVVDAIYRGNVGVVVINNSQYPIIINQGDRIAQGILERAYPIENIEEVSDLSETIRGEKGFGSSDSPKVTIHYPSVATKQIQPK